MTKVKASLESKPSGDSNHSPGMLQLVQDMLDDFEKRWGSGKEGTVFAENNTRGHRRRQVGMEKIV